jgi:hypothetical protein
VLDAIEDPPSRVLLRHYPDMRSAVEAFADRKFGPGGPFHPDTPGPWKESSRVRASAEVHSEEFKECVALQAQHIYDRFPAMVGQEPEVAVALNWR